jgi:hypothetical protein
VDASHQGQVAGILSIDINLPGPKDDIYSKLLFIVAGNPTSPSAQSMSIDRLLASLLSFPI